MIHKPLHMKLKTLLLVLLVIFTELLIAQAPFFNFTKGYGQDAGRRDFGHCVETDCLGNVIMVGQFQDTVTFGTTTFISAGSRDPFIVKYDPAGNVIWAVRGSGNGLDLANGVDIDGNGNIYVSGEFAGGSIWFGTISLVTSNNNADMFIVKIDPNGNFLWAMGFPSTTDIRANAVTVDGSGQVYFTGQFQGTATALSNNYPASGMDFYVAALTTNGVPLWFRHVVAGGMADMGYGIKADLCGNTVITGSFGGTANFPNNISITGFGNGDTYIAKFDATGNCLWANACGGAMTDKGHDVSLDAAGNVYFTGTFAGCATYGTATLCPGGANYNMVIAKLDGNGNFLWARQGGTGGPAPNNYDSGDGIVTDSAGYSYVTGHFCDTATFSLQTLISAGSNDIFIAKYGPNGGLAWVKRAGGALGESGDDIAIGLPDKIYVCGRYKSDTCWFDGLPLINSGGWENAFIAQVTNNINGFHACTIPQITFAGNTSICSGDSTIISVNNGSTYLWSTGSTSSSITVTPTTTTTYIVTVTMFGCSFTDSITVNVTTAQAPVVSSASDTICVGASSILTANGGSGNYSWNTNPMATGNSVTVTPITTTVYTVTDSSTCGVTTANFTVYVIPPPVSGISGDTLICEGETVLLSGSGTGVYQWSTGTSATSINVSPAVNTGYQLIISAAGCSDTATIFITVEPVPIVTTSGDITIVLGASTLITASGGGTYLWSNGATTSTIDVTPAQNTTFCVIVTNSAGCTSGACVTVTVDLQCGDVFVPNAFSPNNDAMNDILYVRSNCLTEMQFSVFDRWGEKVFETSDPLIGWNGSFKGREMDMAVFTYMLSGVLLNGESFSKKGNVSLVR